MKSILNTLVVGQQEPYESSYRDASASDRAIILPEDLVVPADPPRILVVDDDPLFGKIMQRAAARSGVSLTFCRDLPEFADLGRWEFDVAVIDYDLGSVTGIELAKYIEQFAKEETPVILVSQTRRKASRNWPTSMREFVHKDLGPFTILDAAFEAHEVHRIMRGIAKRQLAKSAAASVDAT